MKIKSASSNQKLSPLNTRHVSPAPKSPRSPRSVQPKPHRGSDNTVTHISPVALRKVPSVIKRRKAKYTEDADDDKVEAKRFHEFAVDSKADDEWTEISTCHRNRLTVRDTLHKENVIRQIGQEVEDEEAEDEDGLDDEAILDELDEDEDIDNEDDEEDEDEDDGEAEEETGTVMAQAGDTISDCGFDTDDEGGFANSSESDGEGSDFEWWAPGRSTAATSTDQLEMIRPTHHRKMSDSSLESAREANGIVMKTHKKSKTKTAAVKIDRAPTPELPDSTDFVCGTLDEDRPLEQAYISCLHQRQAAKHKVTPQDIDPTFPTSDPEMDEEDEVDEEEVEGPDDEDHQLFMHGKMDMHEDRGRRGVAKGIAKKRSPHTSPRRLRSPPPNHRIVHRSPPPAAGRRTSLRSPPPPATRGRHRSPPPRKLFGHSPHRLKSPPPSNRPTSPPNSVSSSIEGTPTPGLSVKTPNGLGTRPTLTKTSSLPRVPTMTKINDLTPDETKGEEDEDEPSQDRRSRGAIDIVKGLEKKRQRRKEKLYQKHCQKAKKEVEKRCKPGRGAERMRELGLELAAYRGKKAEHILSI